MTDICDNVLKKSVYVVNYVLCDDGKFCNGMENCDVVVGCKVGVFLIGSDFIDCMNDVCNELIDGFDYIFNDLVCDDGKLCNGLELCDVFVGCLLGTSIDIDDNVVCIIDICDDGI